MDLSKINGIVVVSGDGLLYEIVNGMLNRKDWLEIRKIPIGIIPGGSGNGVAAHLNVLSPVNAAFAIIKNNTSPLDVFSVIQNNNRYYSILSITWNLIADIDVESEKYRWMGGFRFTFTAINKILTKYSSNYGKLTYIPSDSKERLHCTSFQCKGCTDIDDPIYQSQYGSINNKENNKNNNENDNNNNNDNNENDKNTDNNNENNNNNKNKGPELKIINKWEEMSKEKGIKVESEYMYFVATNLRQLAGDVNAAPFAHLSDGTIDLLFAKSLSKPKLTKLLLDLENGKYTEMKEVEYHKVTAFKLEPSNNSKVLMIDGERLPCVDPIFVEVHPSLLNIFVLPTPDL